MNANPQYLDTTVTFLEMEQRPARRHTLPLGVNAAVLYADKPPLAFYRFLQFQVGYRWHWEQRLRMDDERLEQSIHADTTEIFVLYLDGAPGGFFEISRADPQATDLVYFGLMEHAIGRGLGRWFLGIAIDNSWANDPEKIRVNTCTLDHPSALPLYQKMGYQAVRRAPGRVRPLSQPDLERLAAEGIFAPQG